VVIVNSFIFAQAAGGRKRCRKKFMKEKEARKKTTHTRSREIGDGERGNSDLEKKKVRTFWLSSKGGKEKTLLPKQGKKKGSKEEIIQAELAGLPSTGAAEERQTWPNFTWSLKFDS